jgi:membrane-bound metal-dependent hydrolase YbcI (DUF457 family)
MFIGHYAVALAAKKAAPKTSLGTLFIGAQLVDLLWPLFLLAGVEHVRLDPGNTVVTPLDFYDYPISHSLLGTALWALLFGVLYFAIRKYRTGAIVAGLCVLSHWVLDFLTHRPDLPLTFRGEQRFGLGLWNSIPGTLIVELGMFIVGILIYVRTTKKKDRIGSLAFWGLMGIILVIYFSNLFGPPPPEPGVIAIAGNAAWLFIIWAYWADKHRTPV